eukprot:4123239-Prymnesium_polylepis.2
MVDLSVNDLVNRPCGRLGYMISQAPSQEPNMLKQIEISPMSIIVSHHIVIVWSWTRPPRGHHVVTTWSSRGHHEVITWSSRSHRT